MTSAFFAPRFFLEIDGRDAQDLMPFILEFEYKDNEKKADELNLTISNKGLRWIDDFRIAKGIPVRTRWGYPNDVSDVRLMNIVEIGHTLPEADVPGIKITAYDKRHDMTKRLSKNAVKPKVWGNVSSSDIAKAIASKYNLKTDIENSNDARREYRIQPSSLDDVALLAGLANLLHWDFYVDGTGNGGGVLHFHSKRFGEKPAFEYTYYTDRSGTLLDFDSSLDLRKLPKTGKAGADPQSGKTVDQSVDAKSHDQPYSGSYASIDTASGSISTVYLPTAESNQSVVAQQAKAQQAAIELNAVKAGMTVVGTPKLVSKSMVKLNGVGRAYSGAWRVKEATHKIVPNNVYTTTCELGRNAMSTGTKDQKVNGNNQTASDAKSGPDQNRLTILADIGALVRR